MCPFEIKKNVSLIGKLVIIGGDSDLGVVASYRYEARKFPKSTPVYPFQVAGCYEDFGFPRIEVVKFAELEIVGNPVIE